MANTRKIKGMYSPTKRQTLYYTFTAIYQCDSVYRDKPRGKKPKRNLTHLLCDLRNKQGQFVADHTWVRSDRCSPLDDVPLGSIIRFRAKIRRYRTGYGLHKLRDIEILWEGDYEQNK